jgi:hypothetical protein
VDETQSALVVSNAGGSEDIHPKILGFQWISMDFIVLECWKFPCYFLAILMGNHFFAVIFFGLRFCAGHQQIVSERLRMWQSHYNQSLFWVWFSYPAI